MEERLDHPDGVSTAHEQERQEALACGGTLVAEREGACGHEHDEASEGERGQDISPHELGRRGEHAVQEYLKRRGYDIIETNWSCYAGEADIIAYDDDELVFIEVKTRTSIKAGFPEDAVGKKKRQRYENIALAYLAENTVPPVKIRFDVVALVVIDDGHAMIRHHRDAFSCGD